jgi:siroheme synthase-like protein
MTDPTDQPALLRPGAARYKAFPVAWVATCRKLLVIGGGFETDARIRHALSFDWREIHVVVRALTPALRAFARADLRVSLHERACTEQDVAYADFVLEDCGDPVFAHRIAEWCERHRKPINACDKPDLCDMFYMSLAPIGPMILAISSGGDAPAVSAALRRWLEANLSPGWAMAARVLGDLRRALPGGQARMTVLKNIARHPSFEDIVARNDEAELRDLIEDELRRMPA